MSCPEYRALFDAYVLAVNQYRVAADSLKNANPWNLEHLNEVVECARKAAGAARLALERHRDTHLCTATEAEPGPPAAP